MAPRKDRLLSRERPSFVPGKTVFCRGTKCLKRYEPARPLGSLGILEGLRRRLRRRPSKTPHNQPRGASRIGAATVALRPQRVTVAHEQQPLRAGRDMTGWRAMVVAGADPALALARLYAGVRAGRERHGKGG